MNRACPNCFRTLNSEDRILSLREFVTCTYCNRIYHKTCWENSKTCENCQSKEKEEVSKKFFPNLGPFRKDRASNSKQNNLSKTKLFQLVLLMLVPISIIVGVFVVFIIVAQIEERKHDKKEWQEQIQASLEVAEHFKNTYALLYDSLRGSKLENLKELCENFFGFPIQNQIQTGSYKKENIYSLMERVLETDSDESADYTILKYISFNPEFLEPHPNPHVGNSYTNPTVGNLKSPYWKPVQGNEKLKTTLFLREQDKGVAFIIEGQNYGSSCHLRWKDNFPKKSDPRYLLRRLGKIHHSYESLPLLKQNGSLIFKDKEFISYGYDHITYEDLDKIAIFYWSANFFGDLKNPPLFYILFRGHSYNSSSLVIEGGIFSSFSICQRFWRLFGGSSIDGLKCPVFENEDVGIPDI